MLDCYEIETPTKSPTAHHQVSRNLSKTSEEQELTALLLSSYTNSGDYDGVLSILSSQNDYKDDRLLQKVTFLKAIQLYNAGDYPKAGAYFRRAVKMIKSKPLRHNLFLVGTNSLRTQSI